MQDNLTGLVLLLQLSWHEAEESWSEMFWGDGWGSFEADVWSHRAALRADVICSVCPLGSNSHIHYAAGLCMTAQTHTPTHKHAHKWDKTMGVTERGGDKREGWLNLLSLTLYCSQLLQHWYVSKHCTALWFYLLWKNIIQWWKEKKIIEDFLKLF